MITLSIVGIILLLFLWYVFTPRKKNEEGFKLWNFNEKSWHARYYKWVIGSNLPGSGCPYFWITIGLVAFSPLIFTIYLFKCLILAVISIFPEKKVKQYTNEEWKAIYERQERNRRRLESTGIFVGKTFLTLLGIFILWALYRFFSSGEKNIMAALIAIGIIIAVIGIVVMLRWVFLKLKLNVYLPKFLRPLGYPFAYLWSMVVSIYTNSCPKITWNK